MDLDSISTTGDSTDSNEHELLPRRFSDLWHECTKSITYLQEYLSEMHLKFKTRLQQHRIQKFSRVIRIADPRLKKAGERKGMAGGEGIGRYGKGKR
jgi:hypothetical protein